MTTVRQIAGELVADLRSLDGRVAFAFIYACVGLTCIHYIKDPNVLEWLTRGTSLKWIGVEAVNATRSNIFSLVWWVTVSMTFYVIVPSIAVRFFQRRKLADVGLAHHFERGFWKVLAVAIAIMLPLTYWMSTTQGFSAKYPFLRIYDGSPYWSQTLLIWELVYFLQFFGLEFFFRGVLVHSFKQALGKYSILAMTVPYTMIHFGKPMPETFAAVMAGLFLGWLSYKNGTIWLGLVLHCTVAFSMDILALHHKGLLF